MRTDWTEYWKSCNGWCYRWMVQRIAHAYKHLAKEVKLHNPSILELGSGTGANSLLLAHLLKARKVTLVDFNQEAIKISERLFDGLAIPVEFLNEDIFNLDLDEKFDLVHSEGLLEHFQGEERERVFQKHVEYCKRSGFVMLFYVEKSIQNIPHFLVREYNKVMGTWMCVDEVPIFRCEVQHLCQRFGLKILKEHRSPWLHEAGILAMKI